MEHKYNTGAAFWSGIKDKLQDYRYDNSISHASVMTTLKRVIATIVVTSMSIAAMGIVVSANFSFGYEVIVDGATVGVVPEIQQYDNLVEEIKTEVKANFDTEIEVAVKPEFAVTIVPKDSFTDTESVKEQIKASSPELVECSAVKVDEAVVAYVSTPQEAYSALHEYKSEELASAGAAKDAEALFNKNVTIDTAFVPENTLVGSDVVYEALQGTQTEYKEYMVKEEDTLKSIAKEYNVSKDALIATNPELQDITLGDLESIKIPVETPLLSVIVSKTEEYSEFADFEVEYIEDPSMYEGQSKVITEGIKGEKLIMAKINYIKDEEISREILSEQIIAAPHKQVEKIGTKSIPPGIGSGSFLHPYSSRVMVTATFGSYSGHTGIDFAGPVGSPVVASDTGKVSFAGWKGGYGNLLIIDHGNGYQTYYAHCSALLVSTGQVVEKGNLIAKVGNTGNSTGPHLHFEIRLNGVPQNPSSYVS